MIIEIQMLRVHSFHSATYVECLGFWTNIGFVRFSWLCRGKRVEIAVLFRVASSWYPCICLNLQFVSILVFSITFEIYKRVIDFTSSPVTHPNTLTYTQLCGYEQNKRIWKKLKKKHILSLRTIFEKSSGSGMRNWLYPVRPTEPSSEHFWYARDSIDVEAEKSPTLRALIFTSIQYANKFEENSFNASVWYAANCALTRIFLICQ